MLPKIAIFGKIGVNLKSAPYEMQYETTELDCVCYETDVDLDSIIINERPHVFVTFGEEGKYETLFAAPLEVRRKWLHFPDDADLDQVGIAAFICYVHCCISSWKQVPLVSAITPAYNTGSGLFRPYMSLLEQTYVNWEWVVVDDSTDNGETLRYIRNLAKTDHRIRVINTEKHSGVIGEVKRTACAMSDGDIIVELDHDDELTPRCLREIVNASNKYPEAGFFYTDCAEVDANYNPLTYCDGWGFGYGSYRNEQYKGKLLKVTNAANINPKTIRHLVAAPNHARAWTRKAYNEIGGFNKALHVADDYDLLVRTFLKTQMVRVPILGYIQFMDGGNNTQRVRNADIQRHVRYLRGAYDWRIHNRFLELGLDDFVWKEEGGFSDLDVPNPEVEQVASIIAEI